MAPDPLSSAPTAPTAHLEARFAVARGQTQLVHCLATAPLKIAKTFALEAEIEAEADHEDRGIGIGIGVCVMDCSPGMLAGDRYRFEYHLEANARAAITTQGFTRIHPSRENPCSIFQQIRLESGAHLDFHPEPLMLYRDAALRSETAIQLAPGATLLHSEIVSAGRTRRGEAWQFHAFHSRLRVRRAGRLVYVSQTGFRPDSLDPARLGAAQNFTHQGLFCVFADGAGDALQTQLRAHLDASHGVWSGVSRLDEGGIVVSMLGHRACDLQGAITQLRAATRLFLAADEHR